MYQRPAKTHAAALNDDGTIRLSALVKFVREAQAALESSDDPNAALRFEILGDYLVEDYKPNTPLKFSNRALGL